MTYGIQDSWLTDSGPQFAGKFFDATRVALGTQLMTTNAYHPKTNGHTERDNKTKIDKVRHYIGEHQYDWDDCANTNMCRYLSCDMIYCPTVSELILAPKGAVYTVEDKLKFADQVKHLRDSD